MIKKKALSSNALGLFFLRKKFLLLSRKEELNMITLCILMLIGMLACAGVVSLITGFLAVFGDVIVAGIIIYAAIRIGGYVRHRLEEKEEKEEKES